MITVGDVCYSGEERSDVWWWLRWVMLGVVHRKQRGVMFDTMVSKILCMMLICKFCDVGYSGLE